MAIQSAASRQARVASAKNFTGSVFQDPLGSGRGIVEDQCNHRYLRPPERVPAWHKHDTRQVLIMTTGLGILQIRGQQAEALRPGDVATIQPGVEHWHGASANSLFAHISLLESTPEGTDWGQPVSSEDYEGANTQIRP